MDNIVTIKDFNDAALLCDTFDVTLSFSYNLPYSCADSEDRHIYVSLYDDSTLEYFWSTVFHELAHVECYYNDIYRIYHHNNLKPKKLYKYMKKMALKAERFVDRLAEKNMKIYLPELTYEKGYETIEDIKFLHGWVEESFGV